MFSWSIIWKISHQVSICVLPGLCCTCAQANLKLHKTKCQDRKLALIESEAVNRRWRKCGERRAPKVTFDRRGANTGWRKHEAETRDDTVYLVNDYQCHGIGRIVSILKSQHLGICRWEEGKCSGTKRTEEQEAEKIPPLSTYQWFIIRTGSVFSVFSRARLALPRFSPIDRHDTLKVSRVPFLSPSLYWACPQLLLYFLPPGDNL